VYLFKNQAGKVLYVGKAINLRHRVTSYFTKSGDSRPKIAQLVPQIDIIDTIEVTSEFEALLLEAALIRKYLPKFNSAARDDKHPLYIAITKEPFPKIRTIRKQDITRDLHIFGPFPSAYTIKQVLRLIRKIFPYCTCKRTAGRPCLYASIKLCSPCPRIAITLPEDQQRVQKRIYQSQIRLLKQLLAGQSAKVLGTLERAMHSAANRNQFELAAEYRDCMYHVQHLMQPRHPALDFIDNPSLTIERRQAALEALQLILAKTDMPVGDQPFERIEGYDISTLFSQQTTGSMVVFIDGVPDTSKYRRFKIKPMPGKHGDPQAMQQMLERRFSTRNYHWGVPDLIVVDGGRTQLSAALEVLLAADLSIPVIGLAKKEEQIYYPIYQTDHVTFHILTIPHDSPALHVLQHLRDEAHRFAKKYHKHLRRKQSLPSW
jgi:excinuclease ABC subunit C